MFNWSSEPLKVTEASFTSSSVLYLAAVIVSKLLKEFQALTETNKSPTGPQPFWLTIPPTDFWGSRRCTRSSTSLDTPMTVYNFTLSLWQQFFVLFTHFLCYVDFWTTDIGLCGESLDICVTNFSQYLTCVITSGVDEAKMYLLSIGWELLNLEPCQQVIATVHRIRAATYRQPMSTIHIHCTIVFTL